MRSCFYPLSTIPTQGIKKPLPKETNYLSSFASERIYIYSTITVILFPLFLNSNLNIQSISPKFRLSNIDKQQAFKQDRLTTCTWEKFRAFV
jgi:hypothetical protein